MTRVMRHHFEVTRRICMIFVTQKALKFFTKERLLWTFEFLLGFCKVSTLLP